jgi:hypothetical protein
MPKVRRFALSVLKPYAVVSAVLLPLVVASNFAGSKTTKLEVLDVERINIVEKDGTLRLTISNKELSPGLIERGKDLTPSRGRTGLIFYNDEGTECGGLIFSGKTADGKTTAVGSLTFDQYETDQAVALQYVDDQGSRRGGPHRVPRRKRRGHKQPGPERLRADRQIISPWPHLSSFRVRSFLSCRGIISSWITAKTRAFYS